MYDIRMLLDYGWMLSRVVIYQSVDEETGQAFRVPYTSGETIFGYSDS